jgi:hypothetical protein
MADQPVFYHNPMSRGRIVHWMLEPRPAFQKYNERRAQRPAFKRANG